MSNQAPFGAAQCQHVRLNGERCTQPARRNTNFCRFHAKAMQASQDLREFAEQMPVLEDGASIQITIMKVVRHLMGRPMNDQNARAILYGLQLASTNLARCQSSPNQLSDPMRPQQPSQSPGTQKEEVLVANVGTD